MQREPLAKKFIRLLEKENFRVAEARLLASSRSAGIEMEACGNLEKVIETTPEAFKGLDMAIFSSGSDISLKFAEDARRQECVVIDNSSAFRMDPQVPLVIPEINASTLERTPRNHCQSKLLHCSNPYGTLSTSSKIWSETIDNFDLSSGFWSRSAAGLTTLLNELNEDPMNSHDTQESPFPYPIAFNLIPHIDSFREDGYTKEELKMRNESRKILDLPKLPVSCTCIRVPVKRAHSISVNAEFESSVNVPDAKKAIESFNGVELRDDPSAGSYPMPLGYAEKEDCGVGRLRVDHALPNGLAFWVVGDQLWKGAALNAIQIAETLVERQWLKFVS